MAKLIIQIPCYNEEKSLPITLADIPRQFKGIQTVELLVIDDGSTDQTAEVAKRLGVHHVVRLPRNSGLAKAFSAGIEASLRLGADIIVNTDADNQYFGGDIDKLIQPVLEKRAEIVIGTRPIMKIEHFSSIKKALQRLGSWTVRVASNTQIQDAPSGFRAFSRHAAMQLHVFSSYTYTLETIIAAGLKGLAIQSVPIRVNGELRPSKLVKSIRSYVTRSLVTILRIFIVYKPLRFFFLLGTLFFGSGLLLAFRFIYYNFVQNESGHVQSVIFCGILMTIGFICYAMGILADLISVNRRMAEKLSFQMWQLEDFVRNQEKKKNE